MKQMGERKPRQSEIIKVMAVFSNLKNRPVRKQGQLYNSNFTWQDLDGRALIVKRRKKLIDRDIKEIGLKATVEK
jgi:hypothetical protein